MNYTIEQDANAVLLPAIDSLELDHGIKSFLKSGGCSIILGVSREEYVATEMSAERKGIETVEKFRALNRELCELSGRPVLVAVDHELGGTNRLHNLVPRFPSADEIRNSSPRQIEDAAFQMATAARDLGVNCVLSPTLDVVTGPTPWLHGRTWSDNFELVGSLSAAYVSGVQAAGMSATAKHFPGHHQIARDPAIHDDARMTDDIAAFQDGFEPFRKVISSGVDMVMVGPAIIDALDKDRPACVSPNVNGLLRTAFGFQGVIVSDDLDSATLLKTRTVAESAVDALNAGAELLILHGSEAIMSVVREICRAVQDNELPEEKLRLAAANVRALAAKRA